MKTPKQIKDIIIARFTDGRGPAQVGVNCVYRNDDGVSCAVGILIADQHYDPIIEGAAIHRLMPDDGEWQGNGRRGEDTLARALNKSGVPASSNMKHFLQFVQEVHDEDENWTHGVIKSDVLDRVKDYVI